MTTRGEWLSTCKNTPVLSLSTESVFKENNRPTADALQDLHQDRSYSPESRNGPGGNATTKENVPMQDYSVFFVSDSSRHQGNNQTELE